MTFRTETQIEFAHFHQYCLARDLCAGLDVLDFASGEGYGSALLAGVARSVVGVDPDEVSIARAREAYRFENLEFLRGGRFDIPVENSSVDIVISLKNLERIREHDRLHSEVRRVLRPGGLLAISTAERAVYSACDGHFNSSHVLELAESEFEVISSRQLHPCSDPAPTHAFRVCDRCNRGP